MKRKPAADPLFFAAASLLLLFGAVMVFSASPVMGIKLGDSFHYLKRHLFYLLIGSFAFVFGLNLEIQKLRKWALPLFFLSIAFLLMLFIPIFGKTLGGATRWLDLYIFSFQPSELVKFAMVLYFAHTLSNIKDGIKDLIRGLLPSLVVLGAISVVIVQQPDLGTMLSIVGTAFIMFFLAQARISHLLVLGGLGVIAVVVLSFISPYRLRRITAYIDPWKDPLNTGFQIIQSMLAVGSGGLFGLGLGNSRQKFYYLPQQYADFIFAVLAEELGFIGAVALLALFLLFFIRGYRIASQAPDNFSYLLSAGLVSMIFVQALLNILVILGLVPTTGIPLPFISYGGTALTINMFSVGIIANISKRKT